MKTALHKSAIPPSQIFVIRQLKDKHFDPIWHAHHEYQLFVVLQGKGTRFIGDSIKVFRPGELILTGPHLPHLWRSDEAYFEKGSGLTSEGIVIYFTEHFLGEHFLDKDDMIVLKKLLHKSMRGIEFHGASKKKVIEMMHELSKMQGIQRVIQLLEILDVLATTKQYNYISSTAYEDTFDQHETDRLNQVYEYVLKNFRQQILLEDLANLLHITPTSFSRYFTIKNNKSFSRFVSEVRIKEACKLLTETDYSIEQICYECGFNTLSNFNKQFKDIMNQKPTQYKKEFLSL